MWKILEIQDFLRMHSQNKPRLIRRHEFSLPHGLLYIKWNSTFFDTCKPRQVEQSWNKEDTRWSYEALKVTAGNKQANKDRRGEIRDVCSFWGWSGLQQHHKTMQEHAKGGVCIRHMISITDTYHLETANANRRELLWKSHFKDIHSNHRPLWLFLAAERNRASGRMTFVAINYRDLQDSCDHAGEEETLVYAPK
ncbi:hypothetical protein GOODEAATRI_004485 [Goodea atripinnis]|uniref:Uncharacterized protein n=1 Tax=Goodea atripinnis TaxID=208336 RepID=A0ABV0NV65_9TELE